MKKILVVTGPTATGKTDIAISLAKKLDGELVACDSRQVYIGLDIGTGKEPSSKTKVVKQKGLWEIDGVNVWMYDVTSVDLQYSVYDYVKDANQVIEDILERGKLPIIVGGTGLYLKAILEGIDSLVIPANPELRRELEQLSVEQLQTRLIELAPVKWDDLNQSDKSNPRRLVRAIEILSLDLKDPAPKTTKDWDVLKIGLTAPIAILHKRINARALNWVSSGIIEEVSLILSSGVDRKRFKDFGLNYTLVSDYLDGQLTRGQLLEQLQLKTRQYAKRQMTWFRKDAQINWFDVTKDDYQMSLEKLVDKWYHQDNE